MVMSKSAARSEKEKKVVVYRLAADTALEEEKKIKRKAIGSALLSWYPLHARDLPWRRDREPYRIWISEIMLQQTRVETVKAYFKRFMEKLPDIPTLAAAEEEVLLKLWEGLGYYSRARNLKKAALLMMERHGGRMPETYEELLDLPGIGTYTAGAIASIAYNIPVPAVDGNVLRVISRYLGSYQDISKPKTKKEIEEWLKQTMDQKQAGLFNQALFEVGALVCVPHGAPKCGDCPLFFACAAGKKGLWEEIPVKAAQKARKIEEKTVFVIKGRAEGKEVVALKKRPSQGLLASLYEFPNREGKIWLKEGDRATAALSSGVKEEQIESILPLGEAKHVFSHVEWHMMGYLIQVKGSLPKTFISADIRQLEEKYPLPGAFLAYRKAVFNANYKK